LQASENQPSICLYPNNIFDRPAQKEDIVKGFEIGAVDYIAKPFNISELISRVKTHLDLSIKSKELIELNSCLESMVQERTRQLIETNKNLSDTNKKLTEAYEALASLDNAKNDFILHINHELRTPLNGILGFTSLLEDKVNEETKSYIQSINDLVARLIKVAEISLLLTELKTINNEIIFRK
jgi:signal transduction histidine kinase